MAIPAYSSNMSLINPQDVNGILGAALPQGLRNDMMNMPSQMIPGMNNDVMQQAQMMPNQYPSSGQEMMDKIASADQAKGQMDAYKMMAQGMQGVGRGMQMQMPSGNTAQIMRDQNQFRFAGTPQQQMARAIRNRS